MMYRAHISPEVRHSRSVQEFRGKGSDEVAGANTACDAARGSVRNRRKNVVATLRATARSGAVSRPLFQKVRRALHANPWNMAAYDRCASSRRSPSDVVGSHCVSNRNVKSCSTNDSDDAMKNMGTVGQGSQYSIWVAVGDHAPTS